MGTVILLRHGESTWNAEGLFTGWVDVPLSATGTKEAASAGQLLAEAGADVRPGIVYTSVLTRAIQTCNLALEAAGWLWLPVRRSWRLNERHYGALQGKDKAGTRREFGDDQFMLWRRSYDVPPPPLDGEGLAEQHADPRYALLGEASPRTECLKDVVGRMMPYWQDTILASVAAGQTVLIVAHGNSLRALVKHLDGISDEDISELNIPTGIPLVYELDDSFAPVKQGEYLDPEAAAAGAAAVAAQGKTPR
jgi:2,3-bisphosphoglycerate-dependent phosphoglycerate mutase